MKYVRRITPAPLSDAEGLESWLEDLSLQGLYLKTFRPLFCTFVPGPAKKTRYRLEPYRLRPEDDLPCSMLELYRDFGWDYAGTANNAMLIFSTQDRRPRSSTPIRRSRASGGKSCTARPAGALSGTRPFSCWRLF